MPMEFHRHFAFKFHSCSSGTLLRMTKRNIAFIGIGIFIFAILVYQIPAVNTRLEWRYEVAQTYLRNILHPVGAVPTAIPNPTNTAGSITPTIAVTPTTADVETSIPPTAALPPLPAQAALPSRA